MNQEKIPSAFTIILVIAIVIAFYFSTSLLFELAHKIRWGIQ